EQFNLIDRRIDQLFLSAAGEPFVESTLRPLHTLFRRIGWIYHMKTQRGVHLQDTIDAHAAVIDAVAEGRADAAIAASDHLMSFVDGMFDAIEREVAPSMLDCSLGGFELSFPKAAASA
ncbi:MAG: FCD domain-containing protein, partial [Variovorax sp.]